MNLLPLLRTRVPSRCRRHLSPLSLHFFNLLDTTRTSARTSAHPSSMNSDAIGYSPRRPLTLPTIVLPFFNSDQCTMVDYRCFLRWHDDFLQHQARVSLQKQPSLCRPLLVAKERCRLTPENLFATMFLRDKILST